MTELAWFDDDELDGFDLPTLTRPSWHAQAACRDVSRSVFFPDRNGDDVAAARAVCARCSVRSACLAFALSVPYGDDYGVFGGTSRAERQVIRKRRRLVVDAVAFRVTTNVATGTDRWQHERTSADDDNTLTSDNG